MRDFQRAKVYHWERSMDWWLTGTEDAEPRFMTLAECAQLVRRATRHYRADMPRVTDGRGRRWASGASYAVKLPRWARTVPVTLHEAAHCIIAQRPGADKHGPRWLRLYIQLLALYLDMNEAGLITSARTAGLRVAGHIPTREVM